MTIDYRALCKELVDELEDWIAYGDEADIADAHLLVDRARTALAQPEPVGPTDEDYIDCDITGSDRTLLDQFYAGAQREGGSADEVTLRGIHAVLDPLKSPEPTRVELDAMWQEQYGDCSATMTFAEFSDAARAVLARWGRPAIEPVPVSERPWERNGWCDENGWCWGFDADDSDPYWIFDDPASCPCWTHLLPHYALPVPEA